MTMHLRTFGRMTAVALLAAVLVGCAPTADEASNKGASPSVATASAQAEVTHTTESQAEVTHTTESLAHAQFDVPGDWSRKAASAWTVFTSADGVSHVAMGALEASDVNAKKLAEGAAAMGASSVAMMDEQATTFGAEKLPARAADGACKLGTAEGRIGYAVVDLGAGNRVMVIHAAVKDLTDEQLQAGRKAVASLRRR
jgi:hypothetical protein